MPPGAHLSSPYIYSYASSACLPLSYFLFFFVFSFFSCALPFFFCFALTYCFFKNLFTVVNSSSSRSTCVLRIHTSYNMRKYSILTVWQGTGSINKWNMSCYSPRVQAVLFDYGWFVRGGVGTTAAAVTLDTVADESRKKMADGVARSPSWLCSRDGNICCYGDALSTSLSLVFVPCFLLYFFVFFSSFSHFFPCIPVCLPSSCPFVCAAATCYSQHLRIL